MTTRKAAPTVKKTTRKPAPVLATPSATAPRPPARPTAAAKTTAQTVTVRPTTAAAAAAPTSPAAAPKTLAAAARAAAAAVTKPPVPLGTPAVATPAPLPPPAEEDRLAALRKELATIRGLIEQQHTSTLETVSDLKSQLDRLLAPPALDDEIEASVSSLRRLLSELVEQRLESVMKTLADVRGEAGNADGDNRRIVERLDQVLQSLGALPFVAEPMDIVDPIIHAIVEERRGNGVPDGLVVETVRPGYRTARGRVLSKAAVAVSRS
ncbi:nucleotide exchange factor GrpE [Candidatus Binatia bacterium]|nr:nucleotide exchange factor GrpE [Candidatus Binatia bacterium]